MDVDVNGNKIYTIGFTGKSAGEFFLCLKEAGIKILLDIRLNNTSQLAGFTKGKDLSFFLREILNARYAHLRELAPTKELLKRYRQDNNWPDYEKDFLEILEKRNIANTVNLNLFKGPTVLLCSEKVADKCHRRLTSEYLQKKILPGYAIVHL